MVMQWTVNPPPSGTTGSIPVISTNYCWISLKVEQKISNLLVRVRFPYPAPICKRLIRRGRDGTGRRP
jgi:hypothetical protein